MNISIRHLSVLGKDRGFSLYISKKRVAKVWEMLRSTELPIADVCTQVGMPDAQYFSRVFKSYFGMPPSAYREQQD